MIGYLSGENQALEENLILNVNNVGYEIFVGNLKEMNIGKVGDKLTLWVHTHVREDQITLFGFREAIQKKIFLILNGITGIGPKLAMSATTMLSPGELVEAVTLGNIRVLRGIPGVGKKMADRMVLELKDKLGSLVKEYQWSEVAGGGENMAVWTDLNDALAGLGFSDQKIRNVIKLLRKDADGETPQIDQLLKSALQKIKNC